MKRSIITEAGCLALLAFLAHGCLDRKPGPVCPVSTEVSMDESMVSGFDGVDLLVVVDNSNSMEEEQEILATGLFTLINSLTKPIIDADWPYGPIDSVRVAVVSSDMGLQYGDEHSTEGFPYAEEALSTCGDSNGDNGYFLTTMDGTVEIGSGKIKCEEGGGQCPSEDWECASGYCVSGSGANEPVNCPKLGPEDEWAETKTDESNPELALQVACMGQLGTGGCGVEQQLEASVRALTRDSQMSFMDKNHLLAVLIVSDEEDCSVADDGLFYTDEWISGTYVDPGDPKSGLLNTACNLPQSNEEDFLFDTKRYWTELVKAKSGQDNATVFAAIVGVPRGDDGEKSPCEGTGGELDECLELEDMQLKIGNFETSDGTPYKFFQPACERTEAGATVTSASPGRRFVKVAKDFGELGYVYSICNDDWGPAMKEIAAVIQQAVKPQCYDKKLEWVMLEEDEQDDVDCPKCGMAKCEMVVLFEYEGDSDEGCPASFGLDDDKVVKEKVKNGSGQVTKTRFYCPLPKLAAELDCDSAKIRYNESDELGWYYCEDQHENFEATCSDGIDNDGDDKVDCQDDECAGCIEACGGTGSNCVDSCKYGLELTRQAKSVSRGYVVSVQCLQQFSFEDANCQENSMESCTDGKDNDGNNLWDCDDKSEGDSTHFSDPHCCPMTMNEDGTCELDEKVFDNCPDSSEDKLPDACYANAELLGCALTD